MNNLPGHAFVSYVHEDSHDVDRLQRVLEAAGVRVWRDTADLWPGEDWRAKIRQAITGNALVFIACFSRSGIARKVSYQREELSLAIEQLRQRRPDEPWFIPLRLDDCHIPELDIGGGRTLASIQWVDLFGDRFGEGVARLVTSVLRVLGSTPYTAYEVEVQSRPDSLIPRSGYRGPLHSDYDGDPALVGAASAILPPEVWGDVPQRNRNFTGREELLDTLRERLRATTAAVPPHALYGIAGVGKTQLAIEYAYRYAGDYDVVWWTPADQPALVRSSIASLAPRLGIVDLALGRTEDAVTAVLEALRIGQPYKRWLLIFDNADEPDSILRDLVPSGHNATYRKLIMLVACRCLAVWLLAGMIAAYDAECWGGW